MTTILVFRSVGTAQQVFTAWERFIQGRGDYTLGEIIEAKSEN